MPEIPEGEVSSAYGDRQVETGRVVVRESLRSFKEMVVSQPSVEDRVSHTYLKLG